MSKAALRSRRMKIFRLLAAEGRNGSLVIFENAEGGQRACISAFTKVTEV